MIFNSPAFLLIFLPLSALLFYNSKLRAWRLPLLVVLSLGFYESSAGYRQTLILLACIGWVYWLSGNERAIGNKLRLILSISIPLAVLTYFKYGNFIAENLGYPNKLPSFKGELPAGISFYVFHMVSFAIDQYRGILSVIPSRGQFACYISFFPQLVAGPITRFHQVGESIRNLGSFAPGPATVWGGIASFAIGISCKLLLADPLAMHLQPYIDGAASLDRLGTLFLIFGYSFRIYFDFYGYSMMAIGLGALFGIALPRNFDRPYLSANPKEFWRRWHMTLSYWIRDYLYMPLGGNRHYVRNILIVFGACGLWHGAGWNFIVWGLYHAALVLGYGALRPLWDRMPVRCAQLATFILVSIGWPLFALDLSSFATCLANFVTGNVPGPLVADVPISAWLLLALAAYVTCAVDTDRLASQISENPKHQALRQIGIAVASLAALSLLDGSQPFIYFRF